MTEADVASWLDRNIAAWRTWDTPWLVGDQRASAVGTGRFGTDDTHATLAEERDNCFLLHFDTEGRCLSFTESSNQRTDGG